MNAKRPGRPTGNATKPSSSGGSNATGDPAGGQLVAASRFFVAAAGPVDPRADHIVQGREPGRERPPALSSTREGSKSRSPAAPTGRHGGVVGRVIGRRLLASPNTSCRDRQRWGWRVHHLGGETCFHSGMAERVRVREISNDEGGRLLKTVRRSSGSIVTWRRAQIVLWSAQGMDVARSPRWRSRPRTGSGR